MNGLSWVNGLSFLVCFRNIDVLVVAVVVVVVVVVVVGVGVGVGVSVVLGVVVGVRDWGLEWIIVPCEGRKQLKRLQRETS